MFYAWHPGGEWYQVRDKDGNIVAEELTYTEAHRLADELNGASDE